MPKIQSAGNALVQVARGGLVAAVVIAPAAYGLTRPSTIAFFNLWMAATFVIWVLGFLLLLRWPRVPRLAWVPLVGILATGAFTTGLSWLDLWLNATETAYPDILDNLLPYAAFDLHLALEALAQTMAVLAAFVIAIDLFANRAWSRVLLTAIVLSSVGLVVFFILQRTVGGPFQLHSYLPGRAALHFATFRYWGNAAAFLNLTWPLLAAFAAQTLLGRRARGWTVWISCCLVVFAALFLNVSKAGHVLGPIGLLIFLAVLFVRRFREGGWRGFAVPPRILLVLLLPLSIVVISMVAAVPVHRWNALVEVDLEKNPRFVAYQVFLKMLPDAGWPGYGPGNYKVAYWTYVDPDDKIMQKSAFWVAHQDYLQTIIEWGFVGTFFWGWLFIVPSVRLAVRAFGGPDEPRPARDPYAMGIRGELIHFWSAIPTGASPLVAAGALSAIVMTAIHGAVDFPMQIQSLQLYFLLWIALGWQKRV